MIQEIKNLKNEVEDADLILVGIGEEFMLKNNEPEIKKAYENILKLVEGKNYFIMTICNDEMIYGVGFKENRIVRPLGEEEAEDASNTKHPPMWETYLKWLQGTINKKLLLIELGVGLTYPDVIRFPFEKLTYYNLKAKLVRVHEMLFQLPAELKGRGYSVKYNSVQLLNFEDNN